jgi:hypothetical protein
MENINLIMMRLAMLICLQSWLLNSIK